MAGGGKRPRGMGGIHPGGCSASGAWFGRVLAAAFALCVIASAVGGAGATQVRFARAQASSEQDEYPASEAIDGTLQVSGSEAYLNGWSPADVTVDQYIVVIPEEPVTIGFHGDWAIYLFFMAGDYQFPAKFQLFYSTLSPDIIAPQDAEGPAPDPGIWQPIEVKLITPMSDGQTRPSVDCDFGTADPTTVSYDVYSSSNQYNNPQPQFFAIRTSEQLVRATAFRLSVYSSGSSLNVRDGAPDSERKDNIVLSEMQIDGILGGSGCWRLIDLDAQNRSPNYYGRAVDGDESSSSYMYRFGVYTATFFEPGSLPSTVNSVPAHVQFIGDMDVPFSDRFGGYQCLYHITDRFTGTLFEGVWQTCMHRVPWSMEIDYSFAGIDVFPWRQTAHPMSGWPSRNEITDFDDVDWYEINLWVDNSGAPDAEDCPITVLCYFEEIAAATWECSGSPGTFAATPDPAVTGIPVLTGPDRCQFVTPTFNDTFIGSVGCPNTGTVQRKWNNPTGGPSIVQFITIVDTTEPVITALRHTRPCTERTLGTVGVRDACSDSPEAIKLSHTEVEPLPPAGTCGSGELEWTALDECGNAATPVLQTIVVVDESPPTLEVPQSLDLECPADTSVAACGEATATDTCDPSPEVSHSDVVVDAISGKVLQTIYRTWTARDSCGAVTTAVQTITVLDTTDPEPVQPNSLQYSCTGDCTRSYEGPFATDTCAGDLLEEFFDVTPTMLCGANNCARRELIEWEAIDLVGNGARGQFAIEIYDVDPPVFLDRPEPRTVECDTRVSTVNFPNVPRAEDSCDLDVSIQHNDRFRNSCGSTSTITREWIASDTCGNSASIEEELRVVDTVPPLISLPGAHSTRCEAPMTSVDDAGMATASDQCSLVPNIAIRHRDTIQRGCGSEYTISRAWTATDECGNSNTAVQQVRVVDDEAPMLTIPGDRDIECGVSTSPAVLGRATASDNCSPFVEITYRDLPLPGTDCSSVFNRRWTASDGCNSNSGVQRITVSDSIPPEVLPPPRVQITCGDSTHPSALGTATVVDMCAANPVATFSDDPPIVASCTQTVVRRWAASEGCAGESEATQTIVIIDNEAPRLSIPADTTFQCSRGMSPPIEQAFFVDSCQPLAETDAGAPATQVEEKSCGASGSRTLSVLSLTWTVSDWCGNDVSATQHIDVIDTIDPVIVAPADGVAECGAPTGPSVFGSATASDACDAEVRVAHADRFSRSCGLSGTIERLWTAEDSCGNTDSVRQTIVVEDTLPPVFAHFPGTATVECPQEPLPQHTGSPRVEDQCSLSSNLEVDYRDRVVRRGCGSERTIERTWTVEDECGNEVSQVQTIYVRDTAQPTWNNRPGHELNLPCDASTSPSALGTASASDACDGSATVKYTDVNEQDLCGPTLSLTRLWRAEDKCNNFIQWAQSIATVDKTPPRLIEPVNGPQHFECDILTPPSTELPPPSGTDRCSEVKVAKKGEQIIETGCGGFTYTERRLWSVSDECGNEVTAVRTVVLEDTTPPVLSRFPRRVVECGEATDVSSTGRVTAFDACNGGLPAPFTERFVGECGKSGRLLRTFTAEDKCGLVSSFVHTISVEDRTPPQFFYAASVHTVECGSDIDPSAFPAVEAEDRCGSTEISYRDSIERRCGRASFDVTRTWTAEDECGHRSMFAQKILVTDTVMPQFESSSFPSDTTVECGSSTSPSVLGQPVANDNCGEEVSISFEDAFVPDACSDRVGVITRTWTACDTCENCATQVQIIEIMDSVPPQLNIPASHTVDCTATTFTPSVLGQATAFDACSSALVSYSDTRTDFCGVTGLIVRNWTAADQCGNRVHDLQTISIVDDEAPEFVFTPGDEIIACHEMVVSGTPEVVDNCSPNVGLAVEQLPDVPQCGSTFLRTYKFVATDECGNRAVATQTIRVVDTVPPSIEFPSDTQVECGSDVSPEYTLEPQFVVDALSCDDAASITMEYNDQVRSACGGLTRTIVREWTVSDGCENTVSGFQRIEVTDVLPADISISISDIVKECIGDDVRSDEIDSGVPDVNTLCMTAIDVSFRDDGRQELCGGGFEFERTWTATDTCELEDSATQRVSWADSTPPEVFAPPSIEIECGSSTLPSRTGVGEAFDACEGSIPALYNDVDLESGCDSAGVFLSGSSGARTLLRQWTATDGCGFTSPVQNQTITIVDERPPRVRAPRSVAVECGNSTDPSATGTATGFDECSTEVQVTHTDEIGFDCGLSQTIVRAWKVVDHCGNTADAFQTIFVEDTNPPEVSFPPSVVVECGQQDTDPSSTGNPTFTDTCSEMEAIEFWYSDSITGGCSGIVEIEREWTVQDACGNSISEVQTIVVRDRLAPTFNKTLESLLFSCNETVDVPTPVVVDVCNPDVDIDYSDSVKVRKCRTDGLLSQFVRTWTAQDACGNRAAPQVQTVSVFDLNAPRLLSFDKSPEVVECSQFIALSEIDTPEPDFYDECTSTAVDHVDSFVPSDTAICTQVGTLTRTWNATDECGNFELVYHDILVQDTLPPELSLPADVVLECNSDTSVQTAGTATASDQCSGSSVKVNFSDNQAPLCPGSMAINRTWTAVDECGLESVGVQQILVRDRIPPRIFAPTVRSVECGAYNDTILGVATARDECSAVASLSVTRSVNMLDACTSNIVGTLSRTWTALDECSNSAQVTVTTVIVDTLAPVMTDVLETTVELECGEDTSPVGPSGAAIALDGCTGMLDLSNGGQSYEDRVVRGCGRSMEISRLWTAQDPCGLIALEAQTIHVVDTEPPMFIEDVLPLSLQLPCGDFVGAADTPVIVEDPGAYLFDVCASDPDALSLVYLDRQAPQECLAEQTIERVYTALDECGNSRSVTQVITLTVERGEVGNEDPEDVLPEIGDGLPSDALDRNQTAPTASGGAPPLTTDDSLVLCNGFGLAQLSCSVEDSTMDASEGSATIEVVSGGNRVGVVTVGRQASGTTLQARRSTLATGESRINQQSLILEVNLIQDGGEAELEGEAEICLRVDPDALGGDDICLGFYNTQTNEWECEDECLDPPDRNDEAAFVCGTAMHFTNFAVLTGADVPGGIDCGGGDNFITGSWAGDFALVASLISFACVVVVLIVLIVPRVPFFTRYFYGSEGQRLMQARRDGRPGGSERDAVIDFEDDDEDL